MTRYFEVVRRCGAARLGKLELEEKIKTPYIITSDSLSKGKFVMPPEDVHILKAAKLLDNDSRKLISTITKIRDKIPPDTALYTPALARPENLALLIYLGVDLVDDIIPTIQSYQGIYLTREEEIELNELKDLLCPCKVCSSHSIDEMKDDESFELLLAHNLAIFKTECEVIRHRIENGCMREYFEYKCRLKPYLTEALRLLDHEYNYLERRIPIVRRRELIVSSIESLNRVEVRRFIDRVKTRYKPHAGVLLLLPCSKRKPYSRSKTHRQIIDMLKGKRSRLHEVILTSPLAIVPRELELIYPAAHYDTPVTGRWFEEELNLIRESLTSLLERGDYHDMIVHVGGDLIEVCREVGEEFEIELHTTVEEGRELSHISLDNLRSKVAELVTPDIPQVITKRDIVSDTLDYQFGTGAGELFLEGDIEIKGRIGSCSVFDRRNNVALGRMIPDYGFMALTVEGAGRLLDLGTYQVEIDDFIPRGSVLAPGVIAADSQIRPRDEVLICGEKVFGCGKAVMSGWEMEEANRGVAVEVRGVRVD
ncbi:MAG: archaeosine synthase subunit alpha [Candidatus Syntropharchaeales archaeon]